MSPKRTVECCLRNRDYPAYKQLLDRDVDVTFHHCVGRCGLCQNHTFFVIDGEPFVGDLASGVDIHDGEK